MKLRKISAALAGVVALAIVGAGSYQLGVRRGSQPDRAVPTKAASASASDKASNSNSERRVLYWHDPMVPGQRFDKPGKSPFMDMQLVPVYADEAGDSSGVNISSRVQQSLGVRTAPVTKATLAMPLQAVGSVAYNDRDVALVTARNNGYVEKLFVRTTLQAVRQGQPLAQLYVPEWVAAQEEYLSARHLSDVRFEGLADAARQRMALTGMPESVIRQVESSLSVHPRFTVTAPISGVVSELAVREGATLAMGMPMFRINGLQSVWVNAEVPEGAAQHVRPGMSAKAITAAFPEQTFSGEVSAILPEVNPTTRTIKTRVELRNPGGKLVPGMFVTVNFPPAGKPEVVVVPSEAVIRTGARTLVFVADGKGSFSPVEVEPGREANGQTEIRRGLEVGQSVVVSGQFLVDSEASLRGTEARMQAHAATSNAMSATTKAPASEQTYHAEGTIEDINGNEVMVSHGPVPALKWPGMTMGFQPPKSGLPKQVHAGDKVHFSFKKADKGGYELLTVERVQPDRDAGGHQ